jgi:hypothetical protein
MIEEGVKVRESKGWLGDIVRKVLMVGVAMLVMVAIGYGVLAKGNASWGL